MILFIFLQFEFGKNKIDYYSFTWMLRETEHFEIYYYKEEEVLLPFVVQVAESAYKKLEEVFSRGLEEKIPLILYASHSHFEETNITPYIMDEWVGGFTESFQNRVVIPFEGDFERLRHVISHEIVHAFQFEILSWIGLTGVIRRAFANVPLWFIEGMAEWASLGWDPETERWMRVYLVYGELPSLKELSSMEGYIVYKEGQAFMKFIEDRYGKRKIGEILFKTRIKRDLFLAIKDVLGMDVERLDEEFRHYLMERCFPLYVELEHPSRDWRIIKEPDEEKYIYAPSLSPDGTMIAYYELHDGATSVKIMSAIDGREIKEAAKGGFTSKFETIYMTKGKISWSPDSRRIAFVSKSGGFDRIDVYDIKTGKLQNFTLRLDAVMEPSFSPDGRKIAFVGLKEGTSDVYILDLLNREVVKLTNDFYCEHFPEWLDGNHLVFAGSMGEEWDYQEERLYVVDLNGNELCLTAPLGKVKSLAVKDGKIYFVATRNGRECLYVYERDSLFLLLDLFEGITCVSCGGDYLVLSVFGTEGERFYLVKEEELERKKIPEIKEKERFIPVVMEIEDKGKPAPLAFTVDGIGGITYDTYSGLSQGIEVVMSDVLGNHQMYGYVNSMALYNDFYFRYFYLPRVIDWVFDIGRYAVMFPEYYSRTQDIFWSYELWLGGISAFLPLDRFRRFELGVLGIREKLNAEIYDYTTDEWYQVSGYPVYSYGFFPYLAFVFDNTYWGAWGPQAGMRGRVEYQTCVLGERFLEVYGIGADFRKYWHPGGNYIFAGRTYYECVWGRDAFYPYLGGTYTVRGYPDTLQASHIAGLNLEFRFSLIEYLRMGFPPVELHHLRSALFVDAGLAWDEWNNINKDNFIGSFGLEVRFWLGFAYLNLIFAKRFNLDGVEPGIYPDFYVGFPF